MQVLFGFLVLASMLCILLGLIKPTLVLHWGAKRTRLRAVGWYFLFTVVFLVAGVAVTPKGEADRVSQASTPTEAPMPSTSPKEAKQATPSFTIGMEVPVGKIVYVVDSVKFAKRLGNSAFNETADGVFLVVGMTILNNDAETRTLDGSLFKIKDGTGTEYEHSTRGSTAVELSGGKTLFLKQCQPKIPTKGTLVFEVPNQSQPYLLELSGGMWSGKHAQVTLQ